MNEWIDWQIDGLMKKKKTLYGKQKYMVSRELYTL